MSHSTSVEFTEKLVEREPPPGGTRVPSLPLGVKFPGFDSTNNLGGFPSAELTQIC